MRASQPWRTNRSRVLRDRRTPAEDWLWSRLRDRRLNGLKFVRQAPIGPFFVDFLCREHNIVVEVDGATHGSNAELAADAARDAYLIAEGYRVFRAHNDEIYTNLAGVLDSLIHFVAGSSAGNT